MWTKGSAATPAPTLSAARRETRCECVIGYPPLCPSHDGSRYSGEEHVHATGDRHPRSLQGTGPRARSPRAGTTTGGVDPGTVSVENATPLRTGLPAVTLLLGDAPWRREQVI